MYNNREERQQIFIDTKKFYESDAGLVLSIQKSKEQQIVIAESDEVSLSSEAGIFGEVGSSRDAGIYSEDKRFEKKAKVVVSKKRTLAAAQAYAAQKVCVLNFASATNPGGGVVKGSNAQEEAICRCSTLYPCISDEKITSKFHNQHRYMLKNDKMNALYNDDCIYTPDVTVFKTDTDSPKRMPQNEWYMVDVISCAAPNLRNNPSNAMNPGDARKAAAIKPNDLLNLHMKRMRRILDIAKANKEDVMILGAFGCGAFQNSPDIVAEAMVRVIKDYLYDFKTIEFAVYCTPKDMTNYEVFNRRLSHVG
jgi:uncharacterized protein (TIGR02452 family)